MRKSLLAAAVASSLVAVLGSGAAGAAPTPKITVTCTIGDTTVVRWQRAQVADVAIAWAGPAGTVYGGVDAPVTPKPPHGLVTVATPLDSTAGVAPAAATATVTFAAGGAPEVVTADCS
jgi:hypothetical protein